MNTTLSRGRWAVGILICLTAVTHANRTLGETAVASDAARRMVFHVATNGNDGWSGKRPAPAWFKRDGPFATVSRALAAARAIRSDALRETALHGQGNVTLEIHSGFHFLSEPIVLTPEDSGLTIGGEGCLSAGISISGWTQTNLNGRAVFAAASPGHLFQELWVNGRRAIRARHPNTGYFDVVGVPDKTEGWQDGDARFVFKEGDIGPWNDIDPAAKLVVMNRWVESHLPIAEVDREKHIVSFKKRSVWHLGVGDPYYLEGVVETLDAPGEWVLDSRPQMVYYAPRPGEKIETMEAIAPVLEQVLKLEGNPAKEKFVERVTLKGLTFSHTEYVYPAASESKPGTKLEPGGAVQAAYTVPAAVRVIGARNITFENCRFEHLGTYGLELGEGCSSNRVVGCEFVDLAAGGMKIGLPTIAKGGDFTGFNEVADCEIHDGGKVFHSAVGIWVGQSPDNRIVHNAIYNFFYTGISIGWTWGYGSAMASNNLVAFNRVHHIGRKSDGDGPILSDMGGIYTLGQQPGTKILNNVWHDIAGLRYGGWGIYFDEGSSGIVAASNVVFRTTHGGFHQHYGATNTVVNNIFALSRDHQLQRTRAEDHISFFFKTNIVVIDQGVFLGGNWDGKLDSENNLFFDTRANASTNASFAGKSFDQWRSLGRDRLSVFADPLLKSAAFDSGLAGNSPALKLGFGPIDTRQVGPRGWR